MINFKSFTKYSLLRGWGVKGRIRRNLSILLECRRGRGARMLSHWRRMNRSWISILRDLLRVLIAVATEAWLLTGIWLWVHRWREVAVTWSPSETAWVRPSDPTKLIGGNVERHDDQGQFYFRIKSKTDVQVHLGVQNTWMFLATDICRFMFPIIDVLHNQVKGQ